LLESGSTYQLAALRLLPGKASVSVAIFGFGTARPSRKARAWQAGHVSGNDKSHEAGYRDGESSLIADIRHQFDDAAGTMGDLLVFFRRVTGDPELTWPENAEGAVRDG
jgi:hypothetical protein